jgi:5-methylcytosine-specific restriction enzyme A
MPKKHGREVCWNCGRIEGSYRPFVKKLPPTNGQGPVNSTLSVDSSNGLCTDCAALPFASQLAGRNRTPPLSQYVACIYGCERCGGRLQFEEHLRECEPTEYPVSSPPSAPVSGLPNVLGWWPGRGTTPTPPESGPAVRAPISRALRNRIYARDRFTCQNQKCGARKGERGVQLVIDHKKPVARGGTNDPSNLQTLCSLCNSEKGAKNTGFGDWESPAADDWS